MISALDAEECAACPVVNHCDAWNRAGTWAHMKGVRPCRPVALYGTAHARLTITEEPIPPRRIPIIDADLENDKAFHPRYLKGKEQS